MGSQRRPERDSCQNSEGETGLPELVAVWEWAPTRASTTVTQGHVERDRRKHPHTFLLRRQCRLQMGLPHQPYVSAESTFVSQGTTFPRLPCCPISWKAQPVGSPDGGPEGGRKGEVRVFLLLFLCFLGHLWQRLRLLPGSTSLQKALPP